MFRVLVSDPLAEAGVAILRARAIVDVRTGLSREDLLAILPEYDALIVRSETKVTAEVLAAGTRLRVVTRAGVGTDNIDVPAATERGIAVLNTPGPNSIAAAEHTLAVTLAPESGSASSSSAANSTARLSAWSGWGGSGAR